MQLDQRLKEYGSFAIGWKEPRHDPVIQALVRSDT